MIILRLKTWHRGPSRGIIDGMVREYSRANPGVHVLHEAGQRGLRFHDEIQQDFNEGTVSDLFYMAGGSISAPFIDNGDVVELTEEYPQHNWDGILEAPARSMIMRDGRIYGVPLSACQMAFVYRRDVFEKLDLRAPAPRWRRTTPDSAPQAFTLWQSVSGTLAIRSCAFSIF
jgi:ABC-type glycerol-3-phosphate transport system substrate-binding protein